jgi:hypothetical protein
MKTEFPTCGTTRPSEEPVGQVSLMNVKKHSEYIMNVKPLYGACK